MFAVCPPTASVPEYRCRYPLALEWPKYSTLPALLGLLNMLSVGQARAMGPINRIPTTGLSIAGIAPPKTDIRMERPA